MATKSKKDTLKNKILLCRVLTLVIIAFLLLRLGIVDSTNNSEDVGVFIFALILALPLTMVLDKYIIRFAKSGSLH